MRTKGKASISKLYSPSGSDPRRHIELDGKVCFSTVSENDKDNALELLKRWNNHDALVEALEWLEKAMSKDSQIWIAIREHEGCKQWSDNMKALLDAVKEVE